jgi:hypothetical protein
MTTRPDPRHRPRRAGKGEAKESRYEIPIVSPAPSSRGFFAFSGDRDRDRVIAVTMLDSREQAMCAHEQVA